MMKPTSLFHNTNQIAGRRPRGAVHTLAAWTASSHGLDRACAREGEPSTRTLTPSTMTQPLGGAAVAAQEDSQPTMTRVAVGTVTKKIDQGVTNGERRARVSNLNQASRLHGECYSRW